MNRVNQILHHPGFCRALEEITAAEANRPFCGHGLEHLLSVARVAALTAQDEGQELSRPLIYAAALLHDLGRAVEYRGEGTHEEASPALAEPILTDCGFSPAERAEILTAIRQHRSSWQGTRSPLGELLYRADKKSRPCFLCPAAGACNWPPENRTNTLER